MRPSCRPLRLCALAAIAALLLSLAGPAAATSSRSMGPHTEDPSLVSGSLIVTTTAPGAADALPALAHRLLGGRSAAPAPAFERLADRVLQVVVPPGSEQAAIEALESVDGVVEARRERRYAYAATPDDPRYDEQWTHELAGAEQAWAIEPGSRDVRVAVLDSGMLGSHPDLEDNIEMQVDAAASPVTAPQVGVDNATCPDGSGPTGVAHRHGTWVGGIAGAVGNNGLGIAGAAWRVSLLDVALSSERDLDSCLGPKDSAILRALRWARDVPGGVDVVNLSLGGPEDRCPADMQLAIDELRTRGTMVVAAAGNEGADRPSVPASCLGVVAVGAVDRHERLAGYSNRAAYLSLVAPGGDGSCTSSPPCVLTTNRDADRPFETVSGTSFAAPYVAGVAALVRSHPAGKRLNPDQLQALLETTATPRNVQQERDLCYGWGVVHAGAALRWLSDGKPVPERPVAHGFGQVADGCGTRTEPVTQAAAMSRAVFDAGQASHVVIARSDDYADALAGSALGYGVGPVLFTAPVGGLAQPTRAELLRVLPHGGVVYLLGGPNALDSRLEAEIEGLGRGYQVRRVEGRTREHTAVAVSQELQRRLAELGAPRHGAAILATRGNWPDAVAAGSLAAYFGMPVLLTPPGELHHATAGELERLGIGRLYVVGGEAVVTDATAEAASRAAGLPGVARLGGAARDHTAVAVAQEHLAGLPERARPPVHAIAVNLDRGDGYAHVLSASALAGATGAVFVPVRGEQGDMLTTPARELACGLDSRALLAGGVDLLPSANGTLLADLLAGDC